MPALEPVTQHFVLPVHAAREHTVAFFPLHT